MVRNLRLVEKDFLEIKRNTKWLSVLNRLAIQALRKIEKYKSGKLTTRQLELNLKGITDQSMKFVNKNYLKLDNGQQLRSLINEIEREL